jgi:hypothetical protein
VLQLVQGMWTSRTAGGRGSAVTPIQWVIGLLIGGLANASLYRAPDWVQMLLGGLLICMIAFFCVIYCVWMKLERDALRSESYSLRKREIDRGFLGDDTTGLRPARSRRPVAGQQTVGQQIPPNVP